MIVNRVEWVAKQCVGRDVLDVGFIGGGEYLRLHREIVKNARRVIGIDNDIQALSRAPKCNDKCTHLYANAQSFSFNRKFDVIVAGEIIEHLQNPDAFLKSAYNCLRKEGRLIITTPNANNPFVSRNKVGHIRLYNPKELVILLSKHSFKVKSVQYFEGEARTFRGKVYEIFVHILAFLAIDFGVIAKRGD